MLDEPLATGCRLEIAEPEAWNDFVRPIGGIGGHVVLLENDKSTLEFQIKL